MKKIIKVGLIAIVLLAGSAKISSAVQQICRTVTIVCYGGYSTNCLVCGDTQEQYDQAYAEAIQAICTGQ